MNQQKRVCLLVLLCMITALLLAGCVKNQSGILPDCSEKDLLARCREIVSLYQDIYDSAEKLPPENRWDGATLSQQSINEIEARLIENGFNVIDSSEICPGYLTNAEEFRSFLGSVRGEKNAVQEVCAIDSTGALEYRRFVQEGKNTYVYSMVCSPDGSDNESYAAHKIYGWTLTERDNFFYRINPEDDPHYQNYALIRLQKPDETLWGLYNKYILAGGYTGTNIFLTDWTEDSFTPLCFNDVWMYLYRYQTGNQFAADESRYDAERRCYWIPAEAFEEVLLPFFRLDAVQLRAAAGYDPEKGGYPWREIESNDYVIYLSYYRIEPEVTAFTDNADGTISMTVEALCTDLGMDCLFSHEVTVRPLGEDGFQFVSNRVLSQTEYGLPYCQPRLEWEDLG